MVFEIVLGVLRNMVGGYCLYSFLESPVGA